ncbi:hypothetical protein J6590_001828 [Homalodisca vitripennis]|nr:hypothetical protein J6590_001828 [Homalodisca vitripennis]
MFDNNRRYFQLLYQVRSQLEPRIIRINRAKEQKNQVKQQLLSKPKFVSTMLSSSSSEGIIFSELNLTGEELKYLDEIEENQEHNIGNILAVPNLSESQSPPATPSILLDEIGESQEHNISNILGKHVDIIIANNVQI